MVLVASDDFELEEWAKMLKTVLDLQNNFPLDLIPMENKHLDDLVESLTKKAAELRPVIEARALELSAAQENNEAAVLAAQQEARDNESEIKLEGALSIVNSLTADDFESK